MGKNTIDVWLVGTETHGSRQAGRQVGINRQAGKERYLGEAVVPEVDRLARLLVLLSARMARSASAKKG